jgi:hypothetical protein
LRQGIIRVIFNAMTFAICIGSYRLLDFVELNILRCRRIFGQDTPILISDNLSPDSPAIEAMTRKYGVIYRCPTTPYSHFSGDVQSAINALALADATGSDVALKLSMRLIPVLPRFRECIEEAFAAPNIAAVLPARPIIQQMARPMARFYTKFGLLSDIAAIRRGAIKPERLMDVYRARCRSSKSGKDCLVESTWGWLLDHDLPGRFRLLPELSVYQPFQPKPYLRKAQCSVEDYIKVAAMEGINGRSWELREWGHIEGAKYFCRSREV